MNIFDLFDLTSPLQVMDVGAAAIAETPVYKRILDMKMAHLAAFDGDARQISKLVEAYGEEHVSIYNEFLFDGEKHDVFLCDPESGMTSLLKPKKEALAFFNGFSFFGNVEATEEIQTTRLDDVEGLNFIDFLKMDVQGAELEILKNGENRLKNCLAVQLEVSFFALYESQPSFGEVDVYMRQRGYVPHRFLDVKRWSIAPTIIDNNIRAPGNQLLEADIIYISDPLDIKNVSNTQLEKLVVLAHYVLESIDLCVYYLLEMQRRKLIEHNGANTYVSNLKRLQ